MHIIVWCLEYYSVGINMHLYWLQMYPIRSSAVGQWSRLQLWGVRGDKITAFQLLFNQNAARSLNESRQHSIHYMHYKWASFYYIDSILLQNITNQSGHKLLYHTLVKQLVLYSVLSFFNLQPWWFSELEIQFSVRNDSIFFCYNVNLSPERENVRTCSQGPGNIIQHITIQPDCQRKSKREGERETKRKTDRALYEMNDNKVKWMTRSFCTNWFNIIQIPKSDLLSYWWNS